MATYKTAYFKKFVTLTEKEYEYLRCLLNTWEVSLNGTPAEIRADYKKLERIRIALGCVITR